MGRKLQYAWGGMRTNLVLGSEICYGQLDVSPVQGALGGAVYREVNRAVPV